MSNQVDLKSYLLLTGSSQLRLLKIIDRSLFLPAVIVYPTSKCNFRCQMCWVNTLEDGPVARMDIALLEKVIRDISRSKFKPRIHFSGLGEPLIYSDFRQVIQLCSEMKLKWSLTTNAFLLDMYVEDVVKYGCSGINISIHGDQEIHDLTVGVKNAYEKAITSIATLAEVKNRNKTSNPPIAINCVINSNNVLSLGKVLTILQELPVNSITFQHLAFTEVDLEDKARYLILEDDKLNALLQFMNYIRNSKLPTKVNFFPKISPKNIYPYYTDKTYPEKRDCIFPWLSTRVFPGGQLSACGPIWGNVAEHSLSTIVNSPQAVKFRGEVKSGEFYSPYCFRCCHRRYD
jgi:MoaA/NifB/PqqE/SkfB family radical SAM enzyme